MYENIKVDFLDADDPDGAKQVTKPDPKVIGVWLVFKTHFDVGFTDLPERPVYRC